jgi:hypothetical protein
VPISQTADDSNARRRQLYALRIEARRAAPHDPNSGVAAVSVSEFSLLSGVSEPTIHRRVRDGTLKSGSEADRRQRDSTAPQQRGMNLSGRDARSRDAFRPADTFRAVNRRNLMSINSSIAAILTEAEGMGVPEVRGYSLVGM